MPLRQYVVKYLYLFLIPFVVVPFAVSYGVNQKLKIKSFEQLNVFISCPVKENKEEELECVYWDSLSVSDVIILDSYTLEGSTMSVFSSLPDEYRKEDTYKEKYGYKVYNKESKEGFCVDYLLYKDFDYYMFINKSSEHQSIIDDKSVSNDAFVAFNNFIS